MANHKYPSVWTLPAITQHIVNNQTSARVNGQWVPARYKGFCSLGNRLHCAWLVFTGRADALVWPGQGDE